jgi:3-oxoadipate enol-lactonase
VQRAQAWIAGIAPQGYAACCEALATSDLREDLGRITLPTLLLAGASDPVTTVGDAQTMQMGIAGAELAVVSASHLSNLEAPKAFNQAVLRFLSTSRLSA